MKIEKFEDILAWQKARVLVNLVYQNFSKCRDYSYLDQLKRASISICNNIAEGFERRSNKEFKQFLFIAKGSCGETRSMLYNALDLKFIQRQELEEMQLLATEISKMLSGLIKTL